jgi:hypothetical protein
MSDWNVNVWLDPRIRRDAQRLALSRGVREVVNDSTYEPNARVPIGFEPFPETTLAALVKEPSPSRARTIGVLPFSKSLLSELRGAANSSRREALQHALHRFCRNWHKAGASCELPAASA